MIDHQGFIRSTWVWRYYLIQQMIAADAARQGSQVSHRTYPRGPPESPPVNIRLLRTAALEADRFGPGDGTSGSSGSPAATVVGTVLAHARVGDAEATANASAAAKMKPTSNRSSRANPRSLFISPTNFPAGEGSGRGRPVAIPWPGARVSKQDARNLADQMNQWSAT